MKRIDLRGRSFARLTVLGLSERRDASGALMWKCQCACGNLTYASSNKLLTGRKKSCGCRAGKIPPPPRTEYAPKTDCVCYRPKLRSGCTALTEKLCVTRGNCKFYKSKGE